MANNLKNWIWIRGTIVPGHVPTVWRKDECGAWIKYSEYRNRDSQFGWEIDHISQRGPTIATNLRALNWKNNVAKSDGKLKCARTAKPYNGIHRNT